MRRLSSKIHLKDFVLFLEKQQHFDSVHSQIHLDTTTTIHSLEFVGNFVFT